MTKEEVERNAERWLEIIRSFIDKRDKLNVRDAMSYFKK